jgi:hypothetical protein
VDAVSDFDSGRISVCNAVDFDTLFVNLFTSIFGSRPTNESLVKPEKFPICTECWTYVWPLYVAFWN